MLGNNEDLEAKIADGTISIEEYNGIKPLLKTLLGDSSIVQNASRAAGDQLDIYNRNNPTKKYLVEILLIPKLQLDKVAMH